MSVSGLYKMLVCSDDTLNRLTESQWEQDVGHQIQIAEWKSIWRNSIKCSKSVRFRMIQLKTLHRAYVTPAKLKKIDPHSSDLCWRGCGERGTLIHMLLYCPEVKCFWNKIIAFISKLLNINLNLCPATCLLGYWNAQFKSKQNYKIANLAFMAAKRKIMINWKHRKPNCFAMNNWLHEFSDLLSMEQVIGDNGGPIQDIQLEQLWEMLEPEDCLNDNSVLLNTV